MSRRVVIGLMPDGTIRLRTSLAGYDALTAPDSSDYISFDSNWADLIRVHAVGTKTLTSDVTRTSIPFANLTYKPFCEVKQRVGSTIFDDYVYADLDSKWQKIASGYDVQITTSELLVRPYGWFESASSHFVALDVYYIIYQLAVPE